MEIISLSMLISLVALFLSLPLIFFLRRSNPQLAVPPGTYGWPIIGETLEFLKETFVEERMEKFSSKIFKTSILGEPVAVFCGPDGNKCLFSTENKRVTHWFPRQFNKIFPFSSNASDGEAKLKSIEIFRTFLKAEALQSYVGMIDSTAKDHLKNTWENQSKEQVNVLSMSRSYIFTLGCKLLVSIHDPIELAKLYNQYCILLKGFLSLPVDFPGAPFSKALKASRYIRNDIQGRIKQRKKMELADGKGTPDIFSQMFCKAEDNDADNATRIVGMMTASHSSSVVITFILKYLAELPHVYDQVLQEQSEILKAKSPGELLNWEDIQQMKYSWNVACEAMRLAAPTRGSFRRALSDFNYAGFSVPKGWKLYWNNSTHRNANYFPDPEKFDPSRFGGRGPAPYTYVPFGGGPYMCPGKGFAKLQILVFMHNMVTKFKWEKIIPDEKVIVTSFPMLEKGLPIRLYPHVY